MEMREKHQHPLKKKKKMKRIKSPKAQHAELRGEQEFVPMYILKTCPVLRISQEALGFEKQRDCFTWRQGRGQLQGKRRGAFLVIHLHNPCARSLPVSFGTPGQDMGGEAESGPCFPGNQDKMDEKKWESHPKPGS